MLQHTIYLKGLSITMAGLVLLGAQWGDEGKGKVTDYLAEQASTIVRYQGGNNAGHTVVVGDEEFKLRRDQYHFWSSRFFCRLWQLPHRYQWQYDKA